MAEPPESAQGSGNEVPTVFRAPDQEEMIARLDTVDDDDADSGFFPAVTKDHGDAAARMFDLGLRTLAEAAEGSRVGPFVDGPFVVGQRAPLVSVPPSSGSGEPEPARIPAQVDLTDPALRAAFILGGPAALS